MVSLPSSAGIFGVFRTSSHPDLTVSGLAAAGVTALPEPAQGSSVVSGDGGLAPTTMMTGPPSHMVQMTGAEPPVKLTTSGVAVAGAAAAGGGAYFHQPGSYNTGHYPMGVIGVGGGAFAASGQQVPPGGFAVAAAQPANGWAPPNNGTGWPLQQVSGAHYGGAPGPIVGAHHVIEGPGPEAPGHQFPQQHGHDIGIGAVQYYGAHAQNNGYHVELPPAAPGAPATGGPPISFSLPAQQSLPSQPSDSASTPTGRGSTRSRPGASPHSPGASPTRLNFSSAPQMWPASGGDPALNSARVEAAADNVAVGAPHPAPALHGGEAALAVASAPCGPGATSAEDAPTTTSLTPEERHDLEQSLRRQIEQERAEIEQIQEQTAFIEQHCAEQEAAISRSKRSSRSKSREPCAERDC